MLTLHCPVCKQEFRSELSMRNHHRNLHDCAFWAQTFEKVLVREAIVHPEKETYVQSILGSAKAAVLDKAKSLEAKAQAGAKLTNHIKDIKAKNNPKNK